MEAQLPHTRPDLTELRAVGGALLTFLAERRERDAVVPDELWRAAERFQPLLDGIDPEPEEGEELWELALALPGLLAQAGSAAGAAGAAGAGGAGGAAGAAPGVGVGLLVRDGVEHVEPRGA
ncbi:hypothetical protein [Streptacidiphilus anmyonensis]|uniref:hypothetical protein n=1 Tax=Streptacidiphilus anmyonensis TaxID=405782 RepID=UPI0005A78192|nr:hypothetical protein [Streptacidiphilus anmyonensis]